MGLLRGMQMRLVPGIFTIVEPKNELGY